MLTNEVTIGHMVELPYAVEEAVNRLRVNISFLGSDIKKIMVISTVPNEGKSFVTMHLWRQTAQMGFKALFLDMDLRKSVIMDKYDIKQNDGETTVRGTSYVLSHDIALKEAVLHTQIEGGDILPNVKNLVNPSMLVESRQFETLLEQAAQDYRYVFVDSPPLGLVSDGEKIGSMCDGAILVVRAGYTQKRAVRSSLRQLERAGCPVLGAVLNRVGANNGKYYYHRYGSKYYGYGYGYYGKGQDYYYTDK